MKLRKEKGGSGIRWQGTEYEWAKDGAVTEVPDDLGRELLAIPEGGFEKAGKDDEPEDGREITEVIPSGYVREEDAPSTPGDFGEVPDRLSERAAYRESESGPETVPPAPPLTGEHPRVEAPDERRAELGAPSAPEPVAEDAAEPEKPKASRQPKAAPKPKA